MHTLEQLRSGELTGTRRLDLACGLERLPPEVFDLADTLEVLNLTNNRLSSLPPELSRLHRLKIIFASNNAFTELPPVLGECPALEMVGFKANRIAHVPAAALPAKLRWLILTDNAIERLPAELGQRPALQKLMLAGNRLQALPDDLAGAARLELLRLSANRLTSLPGWLTELPRLAWLALAGNPLGWERAPEAPLPRVAWSRLQVQARLGEGASGHIHRVRFDDTVDHVLALKLFKDAVTSDGLPEHEMAACIAAGRHPALCTPLAEVTGHPEGRMGMLMPLLDPQWRSLAGPPSLASCTRDVYAEGFDIPLPSALRLAHTMAGALAHLHRRGVMHGDFYAHNVLWNPLDGTAMLSDLGGATLLPGGDPAGSRPWLSLDVRAFGCLLEELIGHAPANAPLAAVRQQLASLCAACLDDHPWERPSMNEVEHQMAALHSTASHAKNG